MLPGRVQQYFSDKSFFSKELENKTATLYSEDITLYLRML